jgi:CelD/BcsL family acetyltransferase involved in cellulose biosynthesis
MEIKVFDFSAYDKISSKWQSLLEHTRADAVFSSPVWSFCWGEVFGGKASIRFVTAWEHGDLAGVLPVVLTPASLKNGGGRVLEFVGGNLADYANPIAEKDREIEVLRELFKAALNLKPAFDVLALRHLTENVTSSARAALNELGLTGLERTEVAPFIQLSPHFSYEEVEKTWPSSHRGDIRRQRKRLAKLGKVDFIYQANQDLLREYFSEFYRLYASKWGGNRLVERFLWELAVNHPLSKFSLLLIDQKPVAYHFGFSSESRYYYYLPSYHKELENYSPGKVLASFLIERACQEKLPCFDFMLGAESYKYRWGVKERLVTSVYVPLTLRGKLAGWWMSQGKEKLKRFMSR